MKKEQLQPENPAIPSRKIGNIEPQRIIDTDVYEILMHLGKAKQLYKKVQGEYIQKGCKLHDEALRDFSGSIDDCISLTTILCGAKLEYLFQNGGL